MIRKIVLFIFAVLVVFSCTSATRQSDAKKDSHVADTVVNVSKDDRQYLVKVGDMAPDFEMQLPDGEKVRLSSLRGKVVMLQFTASWCGVCRKEMPHIEAQIWQKHKDNPLFALYGIDRDEPAATIEELRKATKVTYPIGMDPNGDIFGLYAKKEAGITRNVIIDKDGRIVMLTRLFEEEEFNRMVHLIDKMVSTSK